MNSMFKTNGYKGLKSISRLLDVIIAIREKLDKLPDNDFTDEIKQSINLGANSIAEHYRDPSLPGVADLFAKDYEEVRCMLEFIENPYFKELVSASIDLNDAQKNIYLASIEAHGVFERFFSIVLFQKKINNFIHEINSITAAAIIYDVNEVGHKIVLNPKGAKVYSIQSEDKAFLPDKQYSIKSIYEIAKSVVGEYQKFKSDVIVHVQGEESIINKSALADKDDRRAWLKDFDYEILSILLSYYVLRKTELNRIGKVLDRYNMFCEDRQNIYNLISNYSEGDDSVLKEIRSITERYFYNNPLECYDNYTYCCEILNIVPESLLDIRSIDALIATVDKLSDEVPPLKRPSKTELSTEERKGQLYELRKMEKRFEEVKKMVEIVKERQAERLADIYRNIED